MHLPSLLGGGDRLVEDGGKPVGASGGLVVEPRPHELVSQWLPWSEEVWVEDVSGVIGQLGEEHELGSGVSLTETVDRKPGTIRSDATRR